MLALVLETSDDLMRSFAIVRRQASRLYGNERDEFIEAVEEVLIPNRAKPESRMLTWNQICEMHAGGIGFGSHTVSHPILSQIPQAELKKELMESKEHLSDQ